MVSTNRNAFCSRNPSMPVEGSSVVMSITHLAGPRHAMSGTAASEDVKARAARWNRPTVALVLIVSNGSICYHWQ